MKRSMIYSAFCSALVLPILAVSAFAESTELDTIVVTATRTEQKLADTLASSTVITREEIERTQATDLMSLLKHSVGIDIARNGGRGSETGLFVRGTSSSQTIVLVDGIKVNAATNGQASFAHIPLSQIEKIEIVRGPNSSLYGSEAVGGVIQIFTRKDHGTPKASITAGYGTDATQTQTVTYGGDIGNTSYQLVAGNDESNNIDATYRPAAEKDHDHYRSQNILGSASHQLAAGHLLKLSYSRNEGESEFDPGQTKFMQENISASGSFKVNDNVTTKLEVGNAVDNQDTPVYASVINNHRKTGLWQTDVQWTKNNLATIGVDYSTEDASGSYAYLENNRDNKALFLQDQFSIGIHSFQLGARHDDNDAYGSQKTWNVGYGLKLGDQTNLFAKYGTAFKAPTLNDLYWPYDSSTWFGTTYINQGNPALKSESSRSMELGIKSSVNTIDWSASIYRTKIKDLIDWATVCDAFYIVCTSTPSNVSDAVIEGLDLEASTSIAEWRIGSSLNLLNPKDDSTGSRLNRRTKRTITFDVDRSITKYDFGMSILSQGGREDGGAYLNSYYTADLRGVYHASPTLEYKLALNNIFDREYYLANGYNSLRANAMLSAKYTF